MFDQPIWQQLKLKRVRYIVSWDYAKQRLEHAEVTAFMNAARAHKQEVLVDLQRALVAASSTTSTRRRKACKAPSTKAYKAAVKGFRKQFPYAKTFAPVERGQPRLAAHVPQAEAGGDSTTRP